MGLDARTRVSDWAWGLVALIAAVVIAWTVAASLLAVVQQPGWDQLLGALVGALVAGVTGRWFVLGAWRRTVWGAPRGGVRDVREQRARSRSGDAINGVKEH